MSVERGKNENQNPKNRKTTFFNIQKPKWNDTLNKTKETKDISVSIGTDIAIVLEVIPVFVLA